MKPNELADEIRKIRSKKVSDSKSRKLIDEILYGGKKSEEEWLDLETRVKEFIATEASDDDKKELSGYTEMLLMVCNGIRSKNKKD